PHRIFQCGCYWYKTTARVMPEWGETLKHIRFPTRQAAGWLRKKTAGVESGTHLINRRDELRESARSLTWADFGLAELVPPSRVIYGMRSRPEAPAWPLAADCPLP